MPGVSTTRLGEDPALGGATPLSEVEREKLGGVADENGKAGDHATSAFSAIEPLFDDVRGRFGLATKTYYLYGHSAGAQFAHRFAMFGFGPRASAVISANAGWYTFPGSGDWPYGPDRLSEGLYDPDTALAAPLAVLAGEADTDPMHPSLRRSRQANAQGAARYDRALAFYAAGAELAAADVRAGERILLKTANSPRAWASPTRRSR